jgi:protocatechuate 3,4-dioxygenase, beta subunit
MADHDTTRVGARRNPTFPPYLYEAYKSTLRRAPSRPLEGLPRTLSEMTGPGPTISSIAREDNDLTRNSGTDGIAIGERIIVTGRVVDGSGNPVANTLIEIWQANAAGRYVHRGDQHDAPIDPNFLGMGRCLTNRAGEYTFLTVRPGAYPWLNHPNAWRPAHIHFSLFGPSYNSRLVTQMYFPGDPLHEMDPIFNSVPDEDARRRLIARYEHDVTQPEWALGFRFDITVQGPEATPFEPNGSLR